MIFDKTQHLNHSCQPIDRALCGAHEIHHPFFYYNLVTCDAQRLRLDT